MKFKHIIMTRFNLHGSDQGRAGRLTDEWVLNRIESYERISLPSLEGQTNRNFEVVVLLDSRFTSPANRDRIARWPSWVHPVYLGEGGDTFQLDRMGEIPKNAILPFLEGDETHVITTMLDSDDALNKHFVARIQEEAREKNELLCFDTGSALDMHNDIVYWQLDKNIHHMYPSLVESVDDIKTVLFRKHPRMYLIAPVRYIEVDYPYFLRGVDGTNIMTKVAAKARSKIKPPFPLSELKDFTIPKVVDWI
jgi:hypothetical protein